MSTPLFAALVLAFMRPGSPLRRGRAPARAERMGFGSLAKQLSDASESVALNLGEGRLRRAGDKRRHFEMAAGSASEVTVALRIAVAKRYVTRAEVAAIDAVLDRVRAMLYRLTR